MGAVAYYLFYGVNWIVTLLPLQILYIFSDLLFLFFYYFPGYRRQVVKTNLKNAFPEKTEKELITIEKKYYHHLGDLFIETLKLTHMSKAQIMKRIWLTDPDFLNRLFSENRDVALVVGHYGNWEWTNCLPLWTKHKIAAIYKPLQEKHFDKFMIRIRSTFGAVAVPMTKVIRDIIENRKNNIRTLYGFVTDQTPSKEEIRYWVNFLNQDTPVFLGVEKISTKYNMAVIFFNIQKVKRGYYKVIPELLFEHTDGLSDHLITQTHVKKLEEIIIERPEYWLWSHRRWKYKRENSDG